MKNSHKNDFIKIEIMIIIFECVKIFFGNKVIEAVLIDHAAIS
jgi:hypothetical protein